MNRIEVFFQDGAFLEIGDLSRQAAGFGDVIVHAIGFPIENGGSGDGLMSVGQEEWRLVLAVAQADLGILEGVPAVTT